MKRLRAFALVVALAAGLTPFVGAAADTHQPGGWRCYVRSSSDSSHEQVIDAIDWLVIEGVPVPFFTYRELYIESDVVYNFCYKDRRYYADPTSTSVYYATSDGHRLWCHTFKGLRADYFFRDAHHKSWDPKAYVAPCQEGTVGNYAYRTYPAIQRLFYGKHPKRPEWQDGVTVIHHHWPDRHLLHEGWMSSAGN